MTLSAAAQRDAWVKLLHNVDESIGELGSTT